MKTLATGLLLAVLVPAAGATDVEGTVVITRRLSRKKVTMPAEAYSRGVSVDLKDEADGDILGLERSRVVVYLEGKLAARAATVEMVQEGRQFLPDTVAVPVGSTVSFPNRDPIFHNVFSLSGAKSFDLGNYAKNQTRNVTFGKPGVVFVHCHLHPNMAAAILVAPNGYVTTADRDGKFRLPDVPPGEYVAVAWHRAAGYFRQNVRVGPGGNAQLQFLIPLAATPSDQVLSRR